MCLASFPVDDFSRCVPFCGRHAQDARHLGRYGSEGQFVARRLFFAGYVAPAFSRIQRYLVRQWILVASVYGLCLATETGTHSATVQSSAAMGGVFRTAEG